MNICVVSILAIADSAAMNSCVQDLCEYLFSILWGITRSGTVGSYGNLMFNFLKNCQLFPTVAEPFYLSTSNLQWFQFLHILSNTCCFLLLSPPQKKNDCYHIVGVMWCLIVLLICISLMAISIECMCWFLWVYVFLNCPLIIVLLVSGKGIKLDVCFNPPFLPKISHL